MSQSPSSNSSDETTPLMKQYWELKSQEQAKGALLFFRMGDFYELFGEDAVIASKILDITLTSRDKTKTNPTPMAGVPHHSCQGYLQKLLNAGKKVAIAEQMEDPAQVKGPKAIVKREIVRVFTPAVQFDAEGSSANFLATAVSNAQGLWILACLEPSTGDVLMSEPMTLDRLQSEVIDLPIKHLLVLENQDFISAANSAGSPPSGVLLEKLPPNYLTLEPSWELLKRHYSTQNESLISAHAEGGLALGILVQYLLRTQKLERVSYLKYPTALRQTQSLSLGTRAAQHLDLEELFKLINQTRSALGARQLRKWLLEPLLTPIEIRVRQEAVAELSQHPVVGQKLHELLYQLYDLERISSRLSAKLAHPKDTLALGKSLRILHQCAEALDQLQNSFWIDLKKQLQCLDQVLLPLAQRILNTQKEDAPLSARDGSIFQKGTHLELDRLISLTDDGQKWLVQLEAREREATQISTLKVRYNRVFGYYIEITSAHLKNVPSHYQRKQTMVGAERFFTEELKKFEEEIITASSRQKALELKLFEELLELASSKIDSIMGAASLLGQVDAIHSLSKLSEQPGWCFPTIDDSLDIEIAAGRHPLVDASQRGSFVPNDLNLSPQTRMVLLITGPNMGGKSTIMRQVALIVILGQMGAPVPAQRARWGAVSAIHTRIGAQDAISRGQSTFMVEMNELAQILQNADARSLIVLDEIGRGTSTYDGISVAWSTLEWICTVIRARTLFATHYHELTRLTGTLPGLANAHMGVEGGRIQKSKTPADPATIGLRFQYLLKDGPTNDSFGIHVAQLAGLPKPVTERAWKILEELESGSAPELHMNSTVNSSQLSLFNLASSEPEIRIEEPKSLIPPWAQELESTDINQMTPLEALNFLAKLKEKVSE